MTQHASIKFFRLGAIFVTGVGAWVGVWSIVFWDWLGGRRWIISFFGWCLMVAALMSFHSTAL
jgi:hypothetical protein